MPKKKPENIKENSQIDKKTEQLICCQILLPIALNYGFSYFIPKNLESKIGDVVKVPFRKKELFGVLIGFEQENDFDPAKIKKVIEPLIYSLKTISQPENLENQTNKIVSFSPELLKFINWTANYNLIARGLVLKLSLGILNNLKTSKKTTKKQEQLSSTKPIKTNLKTLLTEQQKAANILLEIINQKEFKPVLLDGITGSGKTEVYFRAIFQTLEQEKQGQILILLPEIALTSQLCQRFESQFGFKPDLWHSKISASKKRSLFFKIINGDCKVLIGARSALFLPFKNLKLIVVDEEHDASFKQEDIANYNARDMAVLRAKIENFPIILSSATPSLETYLNAKNGKYELIKLQNRFGQTKKTEITLLDMKKEKLSKDQFISNHLKSMLEDNLNNKRQSLLFLNRRGYAPLTLCQKCGQKISCHNCSSYLTFHQKINQLICHHCGLTKKLANICPNCGEKDCLINCGVGAEKLQEEVLKYFPQCQIGLMTSDNIKNPDDAEKLIKEIIDSKIDIIIGTQMIAKGHHFPALELVGIIEGDSSFLSNDLRTLERSFQLLTQVIGRAGRQNYQGKVILQTYNPENQVFKKIIDNKRDEFLEEEIKSRQALNLPPFAKMAKIIFNGFNENLVVDFAKFILSKLANNNFKNESNKNFIEIFGPAPMAIKKLKNRYNYCLNIKVNKDINLQKIISECLQMVKIPSNIRVKVDVF